MFILYCSLLSVQQLKKKSAHTLIKEYLRDCPDGPVVKNPPANAGDRDLLPGQGRSHMSWGN